MKETGEAGKKKPKDRSLLYAGLGVLFLFLMAIGSSIDNSFVYIFTGISLLFFILATIEWLKNRTPDAGTSHYNRGEGTSTRRTEEKPRQDIYQEYRTASQPQAVQTPQPQQSQQSAQGTKPKSKFPMVGCIMTIVVLSFFGVIGIVFFTVIFGENGAFDKEFFNSVAKNYYDNNQYDSAAINYRKSLKIDPDDIETQMGYGKVLLFGTQQYDSALILFDNVTRLDEQNIEAWQHRGLVFFYQKNYDPAIRQALDVMEMDPTYTQAMLLAGDSYYAQQNYDDAITWYQKAYDGNERGMELAWRMAYMYDLKNNTTEAVPLYEEVLEYDTTANVKGIYERLGALVSGRQGDYYRTRAAILNQGGQ